jgi:2-haloacid dehalogenase
MSSAAIDLTKSSVKALTFDVFGTVVDWRTTVVSTLISSAAGKTSSSSRSANISPAVRTRLLELTDESWVEFASQWRKSYYHFTHKYNPEKDQWRDIDTHHLLSLIDLLKAWGLEGLYDENEVEDLSKVWHFLDPWADSSDGIHRLGKKFITSTLSNGTQELLADLNEHGDLGFRMIQSSGDFGAFKPHPNVYNGAVKKFGLEPGEVAMVAAHLGDLAGARSCGLRTIYVERPQEESWKPDEEQYKEAQGWVDMWVKVGEGGMLEVARRFGIESSDSKI